MIQSKRPSLDEVKRNPGIFCVWLSRITLHSIQATWLGFMEIHAGPFTMGEGDEAHELTMPLYYMSRYPVTVAQFRAFVEESGYKPTDANCLRGISNHPVVDITWHDVRKYCLWLTQKLQQWPGVPAPLKRLFQETRGLLNLPGEAERKEAAWGTGARVYPWGDNMDSIHANYFETGIGSTSAVGCFPTGVSAYGYLDMAGNIWEWTRSLWRKEWDKPDFGYPYSAEDGRENLDAPDELLRVLSGGAFVDHRDYLRCAVCCRCDPGYWVRYIGFRVVLLPSNSDL